VPTPAAYISYSWGDDTPEGREREAIVDDLCRSVAKAGIVIGRDKNEVKNGDSIQAFGVRIAQAPVILAVISSRSLRSQRCMIYELYRAFLRRGLSGKDFGNDVVALVLDDALDDLNEANRKPLLEYWDKWCEDLEGALQLAERRGRNKSPDSNQVLESCKDMIACLPDMLLAINRIAMPRGNAAIRRDDFSAIMAYVQGKLPSAAQEIPAPPTPDLTAIRATLQQLSLQHAALTPDQLHASWHGAIQATWPLQTSAALFPQLASHVPVRWQDLQQSLADANQWNHLEIERIKLLFEHFTSRLKQLASDASPDAPSPSTPASIPPSLAVLIRPTGDKSTDGQAAYRCQAVLSIPMAGGDRQYEPMEPTADHVFCFHPPADRPDWRPPGAVLGRLWQAAQERLLELGRHDHEPLLDLFVPRALFDQEWWRLELENDSDYGASLATIFYRLRSIDRWTQPTLLLHQQHFDRKHSVLASGAGHWQLFTEHHSSDEIHRQLPLSRTSSSGQSETVAILRFGSIGLDFPERDRFYRSALESAAPVVLWWDRSSENHTAQERARHVTQLLQRLQLNKPTKNQHHFQKVNGNPLDLHVQKRDLPDSLVVLIDDRLEMDQGSGIPRLIAVAKRAPSLGYGGSG